MKRTRFTEEQIIWALKEHEAGAKASDLARKHGVSEVTLYNWKAKYGGMDVSEAKRLKQVKEEDSGLDPLMALPETAECRYGKQQDSHRNWRLPRHRRSRGPGLSRSRL
jgi:putative transposase